MASPSNSWKSLLAGGIVYLTDLLLVTSCDSRYTPGEGLWLQMLLEASLASCWSIWMLAICTNCWKIPWNCDVFISFVNAASVRTCACSSVLSMDVSPTFTKSIGRQRHWFDPVWWLGFLKARAKCPLGRDGPGERCLVSPTWSQTKGHQTSSDCQRHATFNTRIRNAQSDRL